MYFEPDEKEGNVGHAERGGEKDEKNLQQI